MPVPIRKRFSVPKRSRIGRNGKAQLQVELLENRLVPTIFKVMNALDSGNGSLRDAITQANADTTAETDVIQFNIASSGVQIITLDADTGPLPALTRPTLIDGSTEPGFSGTPLIVLDGSALSTGDGLVINAAGSTIKSLAIDNFTSGSGVVIGGFGSTGVTGNQIVGCYLGVAADGVTAAADDIGVSIDNGASGNTIGGAAAADRNIISGNIEFGVGIKGQAASNVIEGNYIGLDATGLTALPNGRIGIIVSGGAHGNTIGGLDTDARNIISANIDNEISIDGGGNTGTSQNIVEGNYIGTDVTGGAAPIGANDKPDAGAVTIGGGATNNTIGGTVIPLLGNVISANGSTGVVISDPGTTGNAVAGNIIGLDLTGTVALPNDSDGVAIRNGASNNTIGGVAGFAANVISANNGDGVLLADAATTGNIIAGNTIGTDLSQQNKLGNARDGVHIEFSPGNTIGGSEIDEGNLILNNGGSGVVVGDTTGFAPGNAILGNAIYNNAQAGISSPAGTLANAPTLTTALWYGFRTSGFLTLPDTLVVSGSLTGTPNGSYHVEFFSGEVADTSGSGQGEVFLGSQDVVTDNNGNANFQSTLAVGISPDGFISATATGPDNSTSQFAKDISQTTPGFFTIGTPATIIQGTGGTVTFTVQRQSGSQGTVTVDYATTPGSAISGTDYVPASGTLVFAPGELQKTFTLTVLDNLAGTTTRTLTVSLLNPSGGGAIPSPSSINLMIEANFSSLPPATDPYVTALYLHLLGRQPEESGDAFWTNQLLQGVSGFNVALSIELSSEGRAFQVQNIYQTFLHRGADTGGLQAAVAFLSAGATSEQLKAIILSSPEYFQSRAGNSNAAFVTAIFTDVLGRGVDPGAAVAYRRALDQGVSRFAIAQIVVESAEAEQLQVEFWYGLYLGRQADPAGLTYFLTALQNGVRDELIIATIGGSNEAALLADNESGRITR